MSEKTFEEAKEFFMALPDDEMVQFAMPWQHDAPEDKDADGFDNQCGVDRRTVDVLQAECWEKLHSNPQVNTNIRGVAGRLTGWGFETTSSIFEIREAIREIELDPRNRLYHFWPKYVARLYTEGELFLILTIHTDGFVEIDFLDPSTLASDSEDSSGIIFHPRKTTMPLYYTLKDCTNEKIEQIPSIYVARYPELQKIAAKDKNFDTSLQSTNRKFSKSLGGYDRFVISTDKGFVTKRATSYLRTILQWVNYYENLKKYEIDHKKSSGAYVWVITIEDPKAFKLWLSLSDEDRRKTGILSKKTPGSTLVLPPGMSIAATNPSLTQIKDQDTDILQMVSSGLNEPNDVMTGTSGGSFSSVKATRGPMADRISDEVSFFEKFLLYDFWGSIFFLKSAVSKFPSTFKRKEAVDFDNKKEPVFKKVARKPEELVDISFPISEATEYESIARALLGVKHGPVAETLGIENAEIAKKLGFGGYGVHRLKKATEDELYPELIYNIDAESQQENAEGNLNESRSTQPKPSNNKKEPTNVKKDS